jgi:hypothetical protein
MLVQGLWHSCRSDGLAQLGSYYPKCLYGDNGDHRSFSHIAGPNVITYGKYEPSFASFLVRVHGDGRGNCPNLDPTTVNGAKVGFA